MKTALSAGFSTSISTLSSPSLRTLFRNWYIIFRCSDSASLSNFEPLTTLHSDPPQFPSECAADWRPAACRCAAPAMISNSAGCTSTRDLALLHEEPADDRAKDDNNAYNGEHGCLRGASGSPATGLCRCGDASFTRFPPAWLLSSMPSRARSSKSASGSSRSACAAPMLTVSDTRSPHQRKSAVRARAASTRAWSWSASANSRGRAPGTRHRPSVPLRRRV